MSEKEIIDLYKEGVKEGLRRAARWGGDDFGHMMVGKNKDLSEAIREVDDEPDQRESFRHISNFGGFTCGCK